MKSEFRCDKNTALVNSDKGKIKGYLWNGIYVFKGIPYARAERFHAPKPMKPWKDVFDAQSFGYVCPLLETPRPGGELRVPHRFWFMNEDCLNLNVWTPGLDEKKRPVLVWFHGGGYEAGSAIEHIAYEGENMSREGDVVVVSVNHRLNVLGYMDFSDFGKEYANSGNNGGEDIIESLRWVHNNIALFGGDPENVTIFGQSGGGGKVTTLLQTPAADGLYHKAFNMSGVWGVRNTDPGEGSCSGKEMAEALMKECGVETVRELEKVSYEVLAAAYVKCRKVLRAEGKYVGGSPLPNKTYVGNPLIVGFRKETAHIPMLAGTVFGEFTSFSAAPYDKSEMDEAAQKAYLEKYLGKRAASKLIPLFKEAYPDRDIIDLVRTDIMFRPALTEYMKLRSQVNPEHTYSYLFDHDMNIDGGCTPWHCIDIPYVFHNTEFVPPTMDEDRKLLEDRIFKAVIAFARTGDPGHEGIPYWPSCTPERENTMIMKENWELRPNHDHTFLPELSLAMQPIFEKQMKKEAKKVQH